MSDMSITIKIGGRLEKSFNEAVRAAQNGLVGLNAVAFKEMTEVGNISAASAMKMADAGKVYAGASREIAAAGRIGALASRRMATEGMAAATSSRDIASAGKGTASAFREMAAQGGRAADAILDIASTGKVSVSSVKDIASAVKGAVTGFKDMSAQGRNASKELLAGGKETASLSKDLSAGGKGIVSLSKDMGKAGEMAGAASQGFLIAGAAIAATVVVATTAGKVMKEVAEYSVEVGKEFETSMSDAAATANASAKDFTKMEQAAMEMGKTTSKTASESAKALEYMSLAGWDVDTSISALPSVLKMSEASGMELSQTSDLVTDSMASLGVTVEQLPGYLDVATKAQTKSNQSAQQLMEAYIGVGGTMKNLNVPIEESAAALGVLANRGIKGSEGGNALNAVMVNLTTGTGQAGKMMQELGVSAFDQQGKFIGLEATLQQLNTALQGCSEEQRNAALAAIGGKQHMDALNSLMAGLNTTNEEGISEWAALTNELEDCSGSLQEMRDIKLDNLEGDLKTLESATQDAGIKIYKHLNEPMREFTQFKIKAVYDTSDALESDGFAGMAMAAGGALAEGIGMAVERLPEFLVKAVVSVGSFLVGFATELPASLLTGILKGAPRLLKALPGIGVDIVKAIIKGIFSMGSAPLKAVGSLFFGGGNDKEVKEAGADMAESQASGTSEDMAAVADIPQAPQPAQIDGAGMEEYVPPIKERMPTGGMDGQDIGVPDIAADAAGMTEIADMGPQASGIEQAPAGVFIDAAQQADGTDAMMANMPATTDIVPALREAENPESGILGEGDAGQALISAEEMDTQPLAVDMDMAGMGKDVTAPPIPVAQDIVPTPPWAASNIPAEVTQMSSDAAPGISMAAAQAFPDVMPEITQMNLGAMPDMGIGPAQISAGMAPDMGAEGAQASAGAIQMLADIAPDMNQVSDTQGMTGVFDIIPDAATATPMEDMGGQAMADAPIQDIAAPKSGDIGVGTIQIPPVGIGMTGIGNGIAQAKDALSASVAGSPAGRIIRALRKDADDAAPSDRMEPFGGLMDGIKRTIGGVIDTSKVGIGAGAIAPMAQIPLQGAMQEVALRDASPDMTAAPDMAKGAVDTPGASPGMAPPASMMAVEEPAGGMGAVSGWLHNITDTIRSVLRIPDMDGLSGRSVVDDTLDMLSKERDAQGAPASDVSPTFTVNLIINVEGGGDIKEDVPEAAKLGAREFERYMEDWIRKHKRTGFGKGLIGIFT